MKAILCKAADRGHAHIDWTDIFYSFSYGNYQNANQMNFGAIRFLNDYTIAIGKSYQEDNKQNIIGITIPLKGSLHHSDSYGHAEMIRWGQAIIMNTGSGIASSKYKNESEHHQLEFLQIGITPQIMNTSPSLQVFDYLEVLKEHSFAFIIAPNDNAPAKIGQDAWISLGEFHHGDTAVYNCQKQGNGIYVIVLGGAVQIGDYKLETKDSLEVTEAEKINFSFTQNSTVLLLEVAL